MELNIFFNKTPLIYTIEFDRIGILSFLYMTIEAK